MSIKSFVKRVIPRRVTKLRWEIPYLKQAQKWKQDTKTIEKKEKKEKIVLLFMLQFPETWNSMKTVYEEAVKSENVEAHIIAIPKILHSEEDLRLPGTQVNSQNEAYIFCESNLMSAYQAYDYENKSWLNLNEFEPDYIIYTRPYNAHLPEEYGTPVVSEYAKTCLIPYGYTLLQDTIMEQIAYNRNFLYSTYITFVPNNSTLEMCYREFEWMAKERFAFIGYPRFDLVTCEYTCNSNTEWKKKREECSLRIAWTPRFVDGDSRNRGSHYLEYIDQVVDYMEKHKEFELIIRPHPLMFERFIFNGIMSEKDVEDFKEKIRKTENISFDNNKDYLPLFKSADVLISDFSSLLIEFFATGKPIIFCDDADNFNKEAQQMYKNIYHATMWAEVEKNIEMLSEGIDVLYQSRKQIIENLKIDGKEHCGKKILSYLKNDYYRKS